jgi:hypothetical protein
MKRNGMLAWALMLAAFTCVARASSDQGRTTQEHRFIPPDSTHQANRSVPYELTRIDLPVTLDGLTNEPAWQAITPLQMVMQAPTYGIAPSERTEVLVAYDGDYLYLAARFFDREPEKIQSISRKRDDMNATNDWFGVILDTYNDNENALAFMTTPEGLRLDMTIFNDAQGDSPFNASWNTFWDVATARNGEGWFAEMRIPFSSLRFQAVDGHVVMGLSALRFIAHRNELDVFPAIPPNWGGWSAWKPSQAQKVSFGEIPSHNPIYVTPFLLGGYNESYDLNDQKTDYGKSSKPTTEAGLDIKYGLANNLTLDLTLNTDFAQVEADDEKINLTRFSLFFPEKRLFFQERASVFDFHFDGDNRLFYSRRIGIHDGKLVRIYGGARTIGRIGPWDLGFLYMRTASAEELPSENFTVLRVSRQVINENSRVGGIITSRLGTDGSHNNAYGFDGVIRLFDQDYLTVNWAQTFADGKQNKTISLEPSRIYVDWQRRAVEGPAYDLSYSRAGKEYDPGVGFETREDFSRIGNKVSYGWTPGEDSWLLRHSLYVEGSYFLRNADGTVESSEIGPGWQCDSKDGYFVKISPRLYREDVREEFSLSDAAKIPAGRYNFAGLNLDFITPYVKKLFTEVTLYAGSFYDGKRITVGLYPQWNISPTVNLIGTYEFTHADFADRQQEFVGHLARLRIILMFSTTVSMGAFAQYNSDDNTVTTNFRFRYNPREGIDLYVVYDEGRNTDRFQKIPALPEFSNRTLLLKYSYTFGL